MKGKENKDFEVMREYHNFSLRLTQYAVFWSIPISFFGVLFLLSIFSGDVSGFVPIIIQILGIGIASLIIPALLIWFGIKLDKYEIE